MSITAQRGFSIKGHALTRERLRQTQTDVSKMRHKAVTKTQVATKRQRLTTTRCKQRHSVVLLWVRVSGAETRGTPFVRPGDELETNFAVSQLGRRRLRSFSVCRDL